MLSVIQVVNKIFNSNSYILFNNNNKSEVILIDCGDLDDIIYMKNKYNTNIKCVFITHSHYDHIYGLNNLLAIYPNVVIFASVEGIIGLNNPKKNLSKYFDSPFIYNGHNYCVLINKQKYNPLSTVRVEAYYTPGHDVSSMVFAINNECLFTGDSYLPGNKIITSFPGSNKEMEINSSEFIKSMISKYRYIYPGHGNFVII